uniref:FBD domain-containing protein n=1 Tax=Solanum lycopersicum TaxID=4081 RepID=A0A3Q7IRR2_SOLLC
MSQNKNNSQNPEERRKTDPETEKSSPSPNTLFLSPLPSRPAKKRTELRRKRSNDRHQKRQRCCEDKHLIKEMETSQTIEINVPMLRLFYLSGNISSVCLKNVPPLVKVLMYGDYIKAEDLNFAKLFKCCPALEHLLFSSFASKYHNSLTMQENKEMNH